MKNETEYLDQLQDTLYAAVIADVLDAEGREEQAMRAEIRHHAGDEVLVGRAFTMLAGDQVELAGDPYAAQIAATDRLRPGDVVVAAAENPAGSAFWGELFSTAAIARGGRGAIVDGLVRDRRKIDRLGFPTFATGARPVNSLARLTVHAHGVPIRCGGVVVSPGDLVFAEPDGVVVVPRELEEKVIATALEQASKEDAMRAEIAAGSLLIDAWRRHRVL